MTRDEANQLRLIAGEVIAKLWHAGEREQIYILQIQCERSLEMDPDQRATSVARG